MFIPAPKQGLWEQVCGLGAVSIPEAEDGLAVKGQELCYWAKIRPVRKEKGQWKWLVNKLFKFFLKGVLHKFWYRLS